ncbi:hypothetical protein LTR96_011785 [Exophiala xenobiotica]|nr:hypothetical protein LTR92_011369 [Exophiala xenobiotica]KAK5201669.1 hypothetical protein LTR41_012125 [Exophiala xenobiotica]KAK5215679.1 hypothetical protein LTR47_012002 [Exophiala xenobiotica]KAK5240844.1 hypothetical protein LTS06_012327 [Exophiala xenobiotica]KAK5262691.1 hypothetical protein LTR96_011785 [Exophiala xenobiotica]
MQYLTRLFFHFGGPEAFRQLRDGFAAIYRTKTTEDSTLGGCVRALDRTNYAEPLEQRAATASAYGNRAQLQKDLRLRGVPEHRKVAMNKILAVSYPGLDHEVAEYANMKEELPQRAEAGRAWFNAYERYPSTLFRFPPHMLEQRFQRLSCASVRWFIDVLYKYRGGRLHRIDEHLGEQVARFLQANVP